MTGVTVTLDLRHSNLSDVSITLQWTDDANTPAAPPVSLVDVGTLNGANLTGTVLDDAAAASITTGTAPYTGIFRPAQPLSGVTGHIGGKYVLVVADNTIDGDPDGALDDWTLTLRYATCDLDTDTVEDHVDLCPGVTGDVATGCPLAISQVSASYRRGRFKGVLSSTEPACAAGKSVTIWKVRPGPDRMIGTRTTASNGTYRLRRVRHPGRYYATSPHVVLNNVAECPAVTSPRFRIR